MDLERVAGLSVRGKHVTVRARINLASALLASDVPNARDGVAALALTKSSAATAVVEVDKGVNALVVTTDQAGKRASRETFGTRGKNTRTELALLGGKAFVLWVFVVIIIISRFARWVGWVGRVGRGRGRVATERVVGPFPTVMALRGRGVIGWLVRSTTAESVMPRPIAGAIFAGRWIGRVLWTSGGKTAVFTAPTELAASTV